jgi:hypothetical protein
VEEGKKDFSPPQEAHMDVQKLPSLNSLSLKAPTPETDHQAQLAAAKTTAPENLTLGVDTFQESARALEKSADKAIAATGGMKLSFHFDLFYSLTQKVSMKMGQSGAQRFTEISASVSETFQSRFSLKIDGVGAFLKGTDASLNISPELTDRFFDAVEGLSDLSPEALESFLEETDAYFGELEKQYGPLAEALDDVKETIKNQATSFINQVQSVREDAIENPLLSERSTANDGQKKSAGSPTAIAVPQVKDLLVSQDDYQQFLDTFLKYAQAMHKQLIQDFFKGTEKKESEVSFFDSLG